MKQAQNNKQNNDSISTLLTENLAFKAQVQMLCEEVNLWRMRAERDSLTKCLRREALLNLIETRKEFGHLPQEMTVVMVDIDHFKMINDKHGHQVGDLALEHVAQTLENNLPSGGLMARAGGEEFLVVLEGHATQNSDDIEKLRNALEQLPCPLQNGAKLRITASLGAADWSIEQPIQAAIQAADEELYNAKNAGRNIVQIRGYQKTDDDVIKVHFGAKAKIDSQKSSTRLKAA